MKTMFKLGLVFVLAAFTNTLFATGNLKVNILPVSAEKAVVAISTLSNSSYKITVTDENERIVYSDENSDAAENYRRVFNFSALENGDYKLKAMSNDLTAERTFSKTNDGIEVGEEKTTLKPFFGFEDGILRCTYLNFPKEDMTLNFYDNNRLMYTKKIGRNFNVCEALNLSKLTYGNYEAVLSAGDQNYSFQIDIR
jgi:hypothetical protein